MILVEIYMRLMILVCISSRLMMILVETYDDTRRDLYETYDTRVYLVETYDDTRRDL